MKVDISLNKEAIQSRRIQEISISYLIMFVFSQSTFKLRYSTKVITLVDLRFDTRKNSKRKLKKKQQLDLINDMNRIKKWIWSKTFTITTM